MNQQLIPPYCLSSIDAVNEPAGARGISDQMCETLILAGVFPTLLGEIASSGYSEDGLRGLLAWAREDNPDCPAPLFIGRLRQKARPPEVYLVRRCPVCRHYDGHSPDCPQRCTSIE